MCVSLVGMACNVIWLLVVRDKCEPYDGGAEYTFLKNKQIILRHNGIILTNYLASSIYLTMY